MSAHELTAQPAGTLQCVECDAKTVDARGWRALLTVGDEDAEEVEEVAVYCPECAARKFGWP